MDPWSSLPSGDFRLPPFFAHPDYLRKARGWLLACQRGHVECSHLATQFVPTRIIEIAGDNGDLRCRLRAGARIDCKGYFALSHCWGDPDTVPRRNKATLKKHESLIPIDIHSNTFIDALRTTKALGYSFIWIDAFCIVQDDKNDWDREAVMMAAVYSNACLTIAAASSADGSEGFLSSRRGGWTTSLPSKSHRTGELMVYEGVTHRLSNSLVGQGSDADPLILRKWCFQERLLSPRILYYSFDEMVWECRAWMHCECGEWLVHPNSNPTNCDPRGESPEHNFDLVFGLSQQEQDPYRDARIYLAWISLIEAYTRANLTNENDILIALAEVAERFARVVSGKHRAGLWTGMIVELLMWTRSSHPARHTTRSSKICAPSWSCASMEGPVVFHGNRIDLRRTIAPDLDAEVISVSCSPATEHLFGHVARGGLKLNARAVRKRIESCESLGGEYYCVRFVGVRKEFNVYLDDDAEAAELVGETIHLLYLSMQQMYDGPASFFLLLVHVPGAVTHRRIGLFDETVYYRFGPDSFTWRIKRVPRRNFTVV